MASHSNRVAAGIFASRVAGLAREILIQAVFGGKSIAADAFRAAMRIPNLIQNLFGEGALAASFVPVYAKLLEDDDGAEARRVASGTLGFLSAAVVVLVALLMLAARPIVWLVSLGGLPDATFDLAVGYTRITAIGVGMVTISAFCLGVLNSHRHYFLSYVAPVAWNGVQILVLAWMLLTDSANADYLSYAVVVGGAAQLAVMWPTANRLAGGLVPHLKRDGQVRTVLRRAGPAISGRGIVQLSSFVDVALASWLTKGAINALSSAMVFYLLPISLFGFSVAATELTEMSRASDRSIYVERRLAIGLRKVALPAGLATAVLTLAAPSVIGATIGLLGKGADADNIRYLSLILASFALGLPAAMTARVTQNALYALGDVRGPAVIAGLRLFVVAIGGLALMFPFDHLRIVDGSIESYGSFWAWSPLPRDYRATTDFLHLGAVGLALASAAAAWVEWYLLRQRLRSRQGLTVSSGLGFPIAAATLLAASVAGIVQAVTAIPQPFAGTVVGIAALGAYIGALRFQGLRPL